jgi:hypothetical protein
MIDAMKACGVDPLHGKKARSLPSSTARPSGPLT